MVRGRGLEPLLLSEPDPKSGASTSSAILARNDFGTLAGHRLLVTSRVPTAETFVTIARSISAVRIDAIVERDGVLNDDSSGLRTEARSAFQVQNIVAVDVCLLLREGAAHHALI